MSAPNQQTIASEASLEGVGLHTGEITQVRFLPAPPGTGIRFQRMDLQMRSMGEEMKGTVRIATVYSVGLYEISLTIKTFLKNYPKVNLHVEYSRANKVYQECQKGEVDIGIVTYLISFFL